MARPLDDREARQVLRYWLGALRFEESLGSRPRAHRARTEDAAAEAASSQPYFRLGIDHAAFWTSARGAAAVAMEPGLQRFQRHWLRRELRRPAPGRPSGEQADAAQGHWIAGWPAVFFEGRDELATLLRFPVQLEWRRGGAPWESRDAFGRLEARRDSPDEVIVRAAESAEGDPVPFSIDRHLLQTTLGFLDEEIAELEARWRECPEPAAIVAALLGWMAPDGGAAEAASPATRFRDVVQAVSRRLPGGVSVYPTGIIQDGSLVFATHHLQRELVELASLPAGASPLQPGTALWSYLTGAPGEVGRSELRGRRRAGGLTASQRAAAELALGSRLAAVQGPPGTGKTELILSLAAHALVTRIEGWERSGAMSNGLMVVASTNNRAVDNAIDPLGSQMAADRLPVALRCGNQELTRTVTAQELGRALTWLSARTDDAAAERLADARGELGRAAERLREISATHVESLRRDSREQTLRRELAALPDAAGDEPGASALHDGLVALRAEIAKAVRSAGARKTTPQSLEKRWAKVHAELVAPLVRLHPELLTAFPSPPVGQDPSGRASTRAAWRETLDEALEEVEGALERLRGARRSAERRVSLARELGELEATPAGAPLDDATAREIEARAHTLFLRALDVRERWAIAQRDALLPMLARAAEAATGARSLRRLLDGDARAGSGLRALYPVIGCTLLSLGNVLELAPGGIDTLVIDEAGQCHPAYPVSGLARARRAVLIGDVQQLPPVVTLSERDEGRIRRAARVAIDDPRFAPFVIHDRAGSSAQALADRAVLERPTLIDHFRCQPAIIALSDALCGYRLVVHTPARSLSGRVGRLAAPVLFDAVRGQQLRARGSWANEAEAERLVDLLVEMRAAGVPLSEVGVLTPYVGQMELLRQVLRRRGIPLETASGERDASQPALALAGAPDVLSLGTVHRFQGGERSVILLSTAITRDQHLAFIDERVNLLNVAISRARDHLVTFGCEEVLRAGRHTRLLVERAARLP